MPIPTLSYTQWEKGDFTVRLQEHSSSQASHGLKINKRGDGNVNFNVQKTSHFKS